MVLRRLPPIPTIRDILKLYRLSATKKLSQNFLINEALTDRIVKSVGKIYNSQILEVGPGPGGITRSILKKKPKKLTVVEKDKRFKPILDLMENIVSENNGEMDLIYDDILNIDTKDIFSDKERRLWHDECPNMFIVGNLPFSISTALIIKWLHAISKQTEAWSHGRVRMTLTFQKEVAERIVADVMENQRCRLSVMAQTWTIPKLQLIIPGSAFVPKPDVDVGVVSFIPLKTPRTNHEFLFFEKVNRHLFSFRQKYCIKCAGTLFPEYCREQLSATMFKLANVNPEIRSYHLTIEDVSTLASAYKYLCEKHPEIVEYDYRASRKVVSKHLTKSISVI